jgi:hypothetical protein
MFKTLSFPDFIYNFTPESAPTDIGLQSKFVWLEFYKTCKALDIDIPSELEVFTEAYNIAWLYDKTSADSNKLISFFSNEIGVDLSLDIHENYYANILVEASRRVKLLSNNSESYLNISPDTCNLLKGYSDRYCIKYSSPISKLPSHNWEEFLASLSKTKRDTVKRALKNPLNYTFSFERFTFETLVTSVDFCRKHWNHDPYLFRFAAWQVIHAYALSLCGYPITCAIVRLKGQIISSSTYLYRNSDKALILQHFASDRSSNVGKFTVSKLVKTLIESNYPCEKLDLGVNCNIEGKNILYSQYKQCVSNSETTYRAFFASSADTVEFELEPPYYHNNWVFNDVSNTFTL